MSKAPYYDNKVTALGSRATSFGYGNKFTLENKEKVPPPNHYRKEGYFEDSVQKRKGYSFNHDSKKGLINDAETGKIPGPGKYQPTADKHDFKRVSYSFRGKYEDPLSRHQNVRLPHPAPRPRPLLHHFRHQRPGQVRRQQVPRLRLRQDRQLAPLRPDAHHLARPRQVYSPPHADEDAKVTSLNNSGTYFYSTFRTSKANAFAHSARKHIADPTISPGPGAYMRFSEFPRVGRR